MISPPKLFLKRKKSALAVLILLTFSCLFSFASIQTSFAFFELQDFFLSSEPTPSSSEPFSDQIIVKFKDEVANKNQLKATNLSELVTGVKEKIEEEEPVFVLQRSTQEQFELNKIRFPERARRAPKDAKIPNLATLKKIKLKPGENLEQVLEEFRQDPNVEYAELVYPEVPTSVPDDPYYLTSVPSMASYSTEDSWAYKKINLNPIEDGNTDSGWDKTQGSENVVVAVFGTGYDYRHEDLADNLWVNPGEDLDSDGVIYDIDDVNGVDDDGNGYVDDFHGWNFYGGNNILDDGSAWSGHDTSVASVIAAKGNNGLGFAGVTWNVKIMPVKGSIGGAIQYATDNGADAINISYTSQGQAYKSLIEYAYANGMIVVYSSDNDNERISYSQNISPYTWIIGATDSNDQRCSFSNYGERLDFVAPGSPIFVATVTTLNSLFTSYKPISLVKDDSDNLYLAFYAPQDWSLKYITYNGSSWSLPETVDGGNPENVGMFNSLALDSSNNPHISYFDWINKDLKYAHYDGSWHTEIVDSTGDVGVGTAIRITSDNYPRIAYLDDTNNYLKYAVYNGSSWDIEVADASVGGVDYNSSLSLVLDDSDNSYISYYNSGSDDLKYAYYDGSWHTETVASGGNVGNHSSIVLASDNNPKIAYTDYSNHDLEYASYNGSSWDIETVDSSGYVGWYPSLVLGENDQPHIAYWYYAGSTYQTKYAHYDGGWQKEAISSVNKLGIFPQLILTSGGIPQIISGSYKEDVFFLDKTGGGWSEENIADWRSHYSFWGGTSFSSPMAAGLAALVISEHPDWTIDQVRWAVASSAEDLGSPGFDDYYGYGRIDAKAALDILEPLSDEIAPSAAITFPVDNSAVDRTTITISGTAADDNFHHYNLFYRKTDSSTWTKIQWYNHTPVEGDTLGSWDTTGFVAGTYELKLEVSDWYQTTTVTNTLWIDDANPIAGNVYDGTIEGSDVDYVNSTTSLSANWSGFSDVDSGIDFYEYAIGSSQEGTDIVDWTSVGLNTSVTKSGLVLTEGQTCYFSVRAYDRAGRVSDIASSDGVTIDTTPPASFTPTADPSGWTNNAQPTITFSTTDALSGLDYYQLKVDDGAFSTVSSPHQLPAQDDGEYTVCIRAYDNVGNFQEATVNVYIDITPPASFTPTANPSVWANNTQPTITFSTTDALSGLDYYQLKVDDGAFSTVSSPYQLPAQDDGEHIVYVRAYDEAGNFREGTVSIYVDTIPPFNGSLLINNGAAYTTSQSVNLTISAQDTVAGVDQMITSENSEFTGAVWQLYQTQTTFNLSSLSAGAEQRTVYIKFKDQAGNESQICSDSIILNVSPGGGGGFSGPVQPPQEPEEESGSGQGTATYSEGGEISFDNPQGGSANVNVPGGAVSSNTTFTIEVVSEDDVADAPGGLFMLAGQIYRITATADGEEITDFDADLTISFEYTDDQISDLEEGSLQVYYYDEDTSSWVALDTNLDAENNRASANMNHLTVFVLLGEEKKEEEEAPEEEEPDEEITIEDLKQRVLEIRKQIIMLLYRLIKILQERVSQMS